MVRDYPTVQQVLERIHSFYISAFEEKIPQWSTTQTHVLLEVQVSMSIDVNFSLVSSFWVTLCENLNFYDI